MRAVRSTVRGKYSSVTVGEEIAAEQAVLDRAYQRLAESRGLAAGWTDVLGDAERGGTHQDRLLRASTIEAARHRLETLVTGGQALCFGRLDMRDREVFHIGRVGVSERGGEPLLVDWRAPVAEPFYRATHLDPRGVSRRRHIRTKGGRVVALDDEWLDSSHPRNAAGLTLVGEAALIAAMSRRRTGRMGDIVATIQAEQDRVIRAPMAGVVVVAGGPGTGKTAVALHRAAFLLYSHRKLLERVGVLVVGPNPVFLRYIERVLPSLDEDAVVTATTSHLYPAPITVMETGVTARVKGDASWPAIITKAMKMRRRRLATTTEVPYGRYRLTVTPADSARIIKEVTARSLPHNRGQALVRRRLLVHLDRQYRAVFARRVAAGVLPREQEPDSAEQVRDQLASLPTFRAMLHRMWPQLTPEQLLSDLFAHPPLLRRAAGEYLSDDHLDALTAGTPCGGWSAADIPLLDEAASILGPIPSKRAAPQPQEDADWMADRVEAQVREMGVDEVMINDVRRQVLTTIDGPQSPEPVSWPREFGHVVVDEAQDLSPMQWRMLARRCPSGSFTIAGDLAQATGPLPPSTWEAVLTPLAKAEGATITELTVNYRTPAEVMELAAAVLTQWRPNATAPQALRATGLHPLVLRCGFAQLAARAARIAAQEIRAVEGGTVGIITGSQVLGDVQQAVKRRTGQTADSGDLLDSPIAVLDVADAKGLEFDSVIVVEPADIHTSDGGASALYVALTRPTQRLTILHSKPLPPGLEPAAR